MDERIQQLLTKWREDRRQKAAELLALDETILRKLQRPETDKPTPEAEGARS